MAPIVETTWRGSKELHPDTRVVTEDTGFDRPYQTYPYGDYDFPWNGQLLHAISEATTRATLFSGSVPSGEPWRSYFGSV